MPAGCCDDAEARRKTQRDKQSTIQWYEFHFTSIQRTSSISYFAVRKTTQNKFPQLKLGPTIYVIGPPVACKADFVIQLSLCCEVVWFCSQKCYFAHSSLNFSLIVVSMQSNKDIIFQ